MEGITPTEMARELGNDGICSWDGDFYAAAAIKALGLDGRGGLLRTGFSMYNHRDEVDRLLEGLRGISRTRAALSRSTAGVA
jgi:selenocysteine lyase/cysteine desulfurase